MLIAWYVRLFSIGHQNSMKFPYPRLGLTFINEWESSNNLLSSDWRTYIVPGIIVQHITERASFELNTIVYISFEALFEVL